MSRYDNAPIGNTCPTIDNIIGKMEEAKNEADWCLRNPDDKHTDELNNIVGKMADAILDMEGIRSDNSTLRDWGNELFNEKDEIEKERDEAISEKESLEEEITELKSRIEELEEKLREVECM